MNVHTDDSLLVLQQMAVRNWCLQFQNSDHLFLHKSHVFSNISKILSKSDEALETAEENGHETNQVRTIPKPL